MKNFWDLLYEKQPEIEDSLGAVALVVMLAIFTAIFVMLSSWL